MSRPRRRPRRHRELRRAALSEEAGQVGGVEALFFGVLVMVLGTLAVASAWGVLAAKQAAEEAASEATRAFVEAPAGSDPYAAADSAASAVISESGRDVSRMHVSLAGALQRCSRVDAEVTYRVPLVSVPLIGGFGSGVVASARHSELVAPYRDGLPGEADCAA